MTDQFLYHKQSNGSLELKSLTVGNNFTRLIIYVTLLMFPMIFFFSLKNVTAQQIEDPIHMETEFCSFDIPQSWSGAYYLRISSSAVYFYSKPNADTEYGGFLFGVVGVTPEKFKEETDQNSSYRGKLFENDSMIYYLSEPTDVQWDYENPEMEKAYKTLFADRDQILATFIYQ